MNEKRSVFLLTALSFGFAFLYVPILSLIVYSFNASKLVTVWAGFSTKWYGALLQNEQILQAAWLSVRIAFVNALFAVCLPAAKIGILKNNGMINNILMGLGIIDEPIVMMQTDFAVYIGIVYSYLPFMILPLYANLERLDLTLLEAAADLGCRPAKVFIYITLPLSMSGVIAGSMLVFIPAVGEFVIPTLLGGPDTLMIGRVLWDEFFSNRDWPVASAVAIVVLLLLVVPMMFYQHVQAKEAETAS